LDFGFNPLNSDQVDEKFNPIYDSLGRFFGYGNLNYYILHNESKQEDIRELELLEDVEFTQQIKEELLMDIDEFLGLDILWMPDDKDTQEKFKSFASFCQKMKERLPSVKVPVNGGEIPQSPPPLPPQ